MEGELQRVVGRNLRAFRQAKGLSQEAFAELVGVHRTYMGGLERGERNLTLRSVERIAARIDVPALRLMVESPVVETSWPQTVTVTIAPEPSHQSSRTTR